MGKLTKLPKTKTKYYGINAFLFRGSILWNSLPNETRSRKGVKNRIFAASQMFHERITLRIMNF